MKVKKNKNNTPDNTQFIQPLKTQMFPISDNHFIDDYARFLFLDTKEKNTAVANSMNYMTKKGRGAWPFHFRKELMFVL